MTSPISALSPKPSLKHQHDSVFVEFLRDIFRLSIRFRSVLYLIPGIFTAKEMMVNDAMAFVEFNKVRGDYLEFGTYQGNSLIYAYHFSKSHRVPDMHFYTFDSFKGLPEFSAVDTDETKNLQYLPGDLACDERRVRRNLRLGGVNLNQVKLIAGYYEDSLTPALKDQLAIQSAAIIFIDCDLYTSTLCVLNFITPYVVDGTVLIFDDWYNFKAHPQRGECRAFTEWLAATPTVSAIPYKKFSWHGRSFILHKNETSPPTESHKDSY